jgi:glycosyltransferase involved in cell wall biosynthesis
MRFSVIVPLYNKGPYLSKALASVIAQTFRDFELIVVDDGSTDDSFQVAQSVLKTADVKHQLIHQENSGVSTARNNGVLAASGDYICFLDADDWWAPSFLESMDWLILEYPDAGIYGTNYYVVKNGRQRICVTTAQTGYINYCRTYAEKLQMPLWTGAVSIPRPVFCETGGFKPHLKLGEDFDLWIRIALSHKVTFLDEPLSYYFQDSDPVWRGTGHLTDPKVHMLWNLDYLSEEEKRNPDYKQLIDNLRTYSLLPYYLSDRYRKAAKQELAKVDWKKQPRKTRSLFRYPVWLLKLRRRFLKTGSKIKQRLISHR